MTWDPFSAIGNVSNSIVKTVEGIPSTADKALSGVGSTISNDVGNVEKGIVSVPSRASKFFGGVYNKITTGASGIGAKIGNALGALNPMTYFTKYAKYAIYIVAGIVILAVGVVVLKHVMAHRSFDRLKSAVKGVPGSFSYSGR